MPTRIRLQRKGKKGQPFYHLVVADGRAPRDGKFIEKLGTYNPMTNPAAIEINFERALHWVQVGAQPSDTAKSILSNQGVMLKHHLIKGVAKGALSEEQVEERFQTWVDEKQAKLEQIAKDKALAKKDKSKESLDREKKVNAEREQELAKKRAVANLKESADQLPAEEVAEEVTEEVVEKAAEVQSSEPIAEAEPTAEAEPVQTEQGEPEETKKDEA